VTRHVTERPDGPTQTRTLSDHGSAAPALSIRQLNLLRPGYLVLGIGLALDKWPALLDADRWELKEGTVECLLAAMALLAFAGLRYPRRMIPILLFEVTWKAIWLAVVALPLWLDDELRGATREQAGAVLWVVVIVAVVPWRHVVHQYFKAPGDPWRSQP
jgi:hypothetical protein